MKRLASLERNTKETEISLELNIDGKGQYDIDTGIGTPDDAGNVLTKDDYYYAGL